MLLPILTSKRMVSLLQSIAGCQMSLEPRSDQWTDALTTQGESSTLMLGACDHAATNTANCVFGLLV